jgi:tRNA(fMet)-specific endonuclease VapC
MEKYLLDTNICIFFLKGKYDLNKQLKKVGLQNCCISEVTLAELKYGAECSERVIENMKMVNDFDIVIGATAIANNMILVTENEKHLIRMSKIKIENWINR